MEYKDELFIDGLIIGRTSKSPLKCADSEYPESIFVISEQELASVAKNREKDPKWGDCWRKRRYSALEDHGIITKYRYAAEGLDLRMVLERAGFTEEEINGEIQFAANHFKVIVSDPADNRFFCDGTGNSADAPALLAFESSLITEDGEILPGKKSSPYPRLMFGQQTKDEINKCSFVSSLRKIQPAAQKAAIKIYKENRLWCEPTMPDLMMLKQNEAQIYANGQKLRCLGIDIALLMSKYEIGHSSTCKICDSNGNFVNIENAHNGEYLLAWHTYCGQSSAKSDTDGLCLCSDKIFMENITTLEFTSENIGSKSLPEKRPANRMEDCDGTSFYCCVEHNGELLYYYFGYDEIKNHYPIHEADFSYDDHTVGKIVRCRGVLMSDITDSLRGKNGERLNLPDSYRMQYMEEDAYHTDIPTYIDKMSDVRGLCRPMLAFEKKDSYLVPDRYHINDEVYMSLDTAFIYRSAVSANEAAVKSVMGVVIRAKAQKIAPEGYMLRAYSNKNGEPILEKKVKGVLTGMCSCIKAPKLARYRILSPDAVSVVVSQDKTVSFTYEELPFITIRHKGSAKEVYLSEHKKQKKTIPESLEYVRSLVKSGGACMLTDSDITIETPRRNLYIDTREITDSTRPFGYDNLLLHRYDGVFVEDLQESAGIAGSVSAIYDSDGRSISLPEEISDCFLAYRHTRSKGVPHNTSLLKRVAVEYERPKLISFRDGSVLAEEIAEIEID